ncbi:MAG TPA: ferrous iron transport protein B [Bacteroidia bacterium]|nr:ferrous iron transport protein B [Bacteroidia bacterium]
MNATLTIALAGNPNSGKTSVFNRLAGTDQKVGNFAGVTVEKVSETITYEGQEWKITDFPGLYSLFPKSEDERISASAFTQSQNSERPDVMVYIADYSQLQRNLLLFTQLSDLKIPLVLAINKSDLGEKGIAVNIAAEIENTLGVKTVLISARKNTGFEALKKAIAQARSSSRVFWKVPPVVHHEIAELMEGRPVETLFAAYIELVNNGKLTGAEDIQVAELEERARTVEKLTRHISSKIKTVKNRETSRNIDRILLNRVAGPLVFLAVMTLVFEAVFTVAAYPMDWIDMGFSALSGWLGDVLPANRFANLLVNGVLPGLGGVVIFIPQIMLLFFFLSLMEETGYMARVAFISDRLMSKVGLSGKSVVPLLSGAACAIPAIMAARNIENKKDRLITMLVIPIISCSARLPVYILLISFIVPAEGGWFIFSYQALALLGMYLLGVVMAFLVALVFKLVMKEKGNRYFVMELPDYQSPRWRNIAKVMYLKSATFVYRAGMVIVPVSIILWGLASFAPGNRFERIEQEYAASSLSDSEKEDAIQAEKLQASYAGEIGRFIEPAIRPLGYDWKIGIALITSFAAREVFVGTMATLYGLQSDADNMETLKERLSAERNPVTGKPVFSLAVAFSLMLFYAFALQCVSTAAVLYKETGSYKLPLLQFTYLGVLAYLSAYIAYSVLA